MATYELTCFFTHVGACLWGLNKAAREKYGYFIDIDELPLTKQTKAELRNMLQEFDKRIDWEKGGKRWSWLDEHRFKRRARAFCEVIRAELGSEYIVKNDKDSIISGIRSAFRERGVHHTDIFEHYFKIGDKVAPYYGIDMNGAYTMNEDYVFRGHHYRAAVTKVRGMCEFMPLDKYTPNFHPEKLKEIALSAEPYDLEAPEIKMFDSKDRGIQARRKATFARLSLKEHYGTDDMSEWV